MKENYICSNLLLLYINRHKESIINERLSSKEKLRENEYLNKVTKLESDFAEKLSQLNDDFYLANGQNLFTHIPSDFVTVNDFNVLFKDEIEEIDKKYKDAMFELNYLYEEVKAHLLSCSSREEGLKVLKDYGIVDSKGKLK